MRQRSCSIRALLFVVALLASLAVPSGIASAASAYDNVIHQGSFFLVRNGNCVGDATTLWMSAINNPNKWTNSVNHQSTIADHLSTAMSNGTGWAVIQREAKANHDVGSESFTTGDRYLTVLISANSSTELNFTTTVDYGRVLLPTTGVDVVQIAWTGGSGSRPCELKVIGSGVSQNPSDSPFAIEDSNTYVLNSVVKYEQVFVNFMINYPSGYEGELIPTEEPMTEHVALGDSFTTGQGNPPFESGTDEDGINECHRSSQAYPRLLQNELNLGPIAFVACSGATTHNVLNGQWNEPAQVDALTSSTELVTMTIGGNDVGFTAYATNCAVAVCGPSSVPYGTIMQAIADPAFKADLIEVYSEILSRASQAKLYVLGYPRMTPPANATDCTHTPDANDLGPRNVVDSLNAVIQDAVSDVNGDTEFTDRIDYVEVNATNPPSPFLDKYICSSNPAFNDVDFGNTEYSYHPNALGHEGYGQLLEDAIG